MKFQARCLESVFSAKWRWKYQITFNYTRHADVHAGRANYPCLLSHLLHT